MNEFNGNLIVISGPSGSGKSTLIKRLMSEEKNIYFSISSTTRPPRENEQHGVNYFFISEDEFKKSIENDEFIEWAKVHYFYYGTLINKIYEALKLGKNVIFDIDVQGHEIVRKKISNLTSIFITTELKNRLLKRNTDDIATIQRRLDNATGEMKFIKNYDYLIINDDFERAYLQFKSIYLATKSRVANINLDFIKYWQKN